MTGADLTRENVTESCVRGDVDFDPAGHSVDAYEFAEWMCEQIHSGHVDLLMQSLGFDKNVAQHYVATSHLVSPEDLAPGMATIYSLEDDDENEEDDFEDDEDDEEDDFEGGEGDEDDDEDDLDEDELASALQDFAVAQANARNLCARLQLHSPDLLLTVSPHLAYARRNNPGPSQTGQVPQRPQSEGPEFTAAAGEAANYYAATVGALKDMVRRSSYPPEEVACDIEFFDRVRADLVQLSEDG